MDSPNGQDAESTDEGWDDDSDELIAAWEEAEAEAVALLQEALPDHMGAAPPRGELVEAASRLRAGSESRAWPHVHLLAASGWEEIPDDDAELVLGAAGALVAPAEETGLEPEAEAFLGLLELADWLGAVIGLVRGGIGTSAAVSALVGYINDCPELEGDPVEGAEAELIEAGFAQILPAWEAAGLIDEDERLTALGRWALPRALAWAWELDFDELIEFEEDEEEGADGEGAGPADDD